MVLLTPFDEAFSLKYLIEGVNEFVVVKVLHNVIYGSKSHRLPCCFKVTESTAHDNGKVRFHFERFWYERRTLLPDSSFEYRAIRRRWDGS